MTVTAGRPVRLEDRYELRDGEIYLSGLQALVRIPLDQQRLDRRHGLKTATFISGYEGSPLAGFDLELSRRRKLLEEHDIVFQPSVNEELGANAVQGSQLAATVGGMTHDGVVGVWYGKAPGLDRATDALRHANLGGSAATGGVLVLVGDDSIAKSSTVPSSSETAMAEIGMTVLAPADPQDVLDLGLHGIALSRFCGLWTGVKLATNVVDGASTAVVRTDQVEPVFPDRTIDGTPFQHTVSANFLQPNLAALERSLTTSRPELARRYAYANGLNRIEGDPNARIGVVAAGASYLDVQQALVTMGITREGVPTSGIRVLKMGMVSPLEPRIVREFAQGLVEIIVVEEKRPLLELAIKDLLYGQPAAPAVFGKTGPGGVELLRADADLPPALIAKALAPRIIAHLDSAPVQTWLKKSAAPARSARTLLPIVNRTPFFCSGCPHNRSTAAPEGSLVGAGIGCSALASFMPEERVGNIIGLCQMGGEGGAWIGMAPFVEHRHLMQNLGDGTFHHSGSLAIRASIAAKSNITYKLLHNGAVAMTGGQQAVGKMSVPQIVASLIAEGVARIVITTEDPTRYKGVRLPAGVKVRHRDRLIETQEELAKVEGVTVLIHDQECATELRRKRKRNLAVEPTQRVFINERVCEGCGDCGAKSNCLSVQPVETEFGRKTQIHQASCNKDFSCVDGDCPSFISVVPGTKKPVRAGGALEAGDLPEPTVKVGVEDFNLRITGIGGTGVVTTAQIISTAAVMAGLYVRSLDQMGMAQKGGAVVSDVRMSSTPFAGANKVGPGECDLYLGCDILVAANAENLTAASPDRTIAVVSTTAVPTGSMVTDTTARFPEAKEIAARIQKRTRPTDGAFADVRALVTALFDDDQYANIFLVGMAVQTGAVPVHHDLIEQAITLNGVAVERNLQAFRRGRQMVADPNALQAALPVAARATDGPSEKERTIARLVRVPGDSPLADLVQRRVSELVAYQDARYARRYAEVVERVRVREVATLGTNDVVTPAVAANLFKLMAYKDEYEVARLSLDPALERQLKEQFGDDVTYSFKLHPPVLRALGMDRKMSLGSWFKPGFKALCAMRRVRGTAWDPFGRCDVRATERSLITEYVDVVDEATAALAPSNLKVVAEIASLPEMVRGYEEVKMGNVAKYREQLNSLRSRVRG
ncbi:indolepyruvate ferredoxin oxidoreductase family protein [Micromonospora sp. NBC_00389]|uniref:indolepyruvate ferredoxin oxidoreductase family protein n=1 Tax=Micromonospora sp. NBC_00389 TaxID=2903586 RepID=UPI002E1C0AC9